VISVTSLFKSDVFAVIIRQRFVRFMAEPGTDHLPYLAS
jgi:hypothetical protein